MLRHSLFAVLALLALLDLGVRFIVFPRYSLDFARFLAFPERASALSRQEGLSIALIGNSALEQGVDLQAFKRAWPARSLPAVSADEFPVAGSAVDTWYFVLNRYFFRPHHRPSFFVILFFEDQLADGNELELGP